MRAVLRGGGRGCFPVSSERRFHFDERNDDIRLIHGDDIPSLRDRFIVQSHSAQVQGERFPHIGADFINRPASGYTAREIGDIGGEVAFRLFDDDSVAKHYFESGRSFDSLSPQRRLLENTLKRAGSQIIAWMTGNGHLANLCRVFELPMAPLLIDLKPSVVREDSQYLANFQGLTR